MTDFSKTLFHCTALSTIMSDGHSKPPAEVLKDCLELLEEEKAKFDAMKDKNSRSALKKEIKIDDLVKKIADLELKKDDVIISEGCKAYLTSIYAYEKYGKWVLPTGTLPYSLEKGLRVESEGIALVNQLDGKQYTKNEKRYESTFICGIPDIIDRNLETKELYIVDIKSSCDIESFFSNLGKELNAKYWWQMQGYFYLTGATKGEVSFCLLSAPLALIDKHIQKLLETDCEFSEHELRARLSFDDIPSIERRLRFVVEREEDLILKVGRKVVKCREYLALLEQLHINGVEATNGISINDLLQDIPKQKEQQASGI